MQIPKIKYLVLGNERIGLAPRYDVYGITACQCCNAGVGYQNFSLDAPQTLKMVHPPLL